MTEAEKQRIRQSILDLISANALKFPRRGWDWVCDETGMREAVIDLTGSGAGNFVDAITTLGLSRYDAVEAFIQARRAAEATVSAQAANTRKGSKNNASPIITKPQPAPLPQPGNVVLPEPERPALAPEARPDANRTGDKAAVAAPVGKPGGDPGVRRSVHRDKKPEPVALPEKQTSLF